MRQDYMLTDEEYRDLSDASRPVPYLVAKGREPISPAAHAMAVWQRIGQARGFRWQTVEPSPKGERYFTAVPL